MIEEDCSLPCPYCGVEVSIRVDPASGSKQTFSYDCEVCCHPMKVQVEYDADGIPSLTAETDT